MPWDTAVAGIEKLLHWVSPRFMTFILLLCTVLFFMPTAWVAHFALADWVSLHRAWLGLGMFVSAAYLIPFGVSPRIEKELEARRSAKKLSHIMSHLAESEKQFLRRFYFPKHVGHVIVWKHEVGKLESDGIVFFPNDFHFENGQEGVSLTSAALKYIEQHQEFLTMLDRTQH
jgi:hypothetical protein